ncbi:MAG: hypothetical protein ABJN62_02705, partial [Halioglobus sp.]
FSFRSKDPDVNIYAVGDQMDALGWQVNRNQFPAGLHAMVTAQHLKVVDSYLDDLQAAVDTVKKNPELAQQGGAATYGMMAHVPLRGMVKKKVLEMYSEQYRAGGGELDLASGAESGIGGGDKKGLLDKLVSRYVEYQSRKASSGR